MRRRAGHRKPSGDSGPPINHEAIRLGTIPWTLEDVQAVFEFMAELHETPHDDWDRSPQRFNLRENDGSVTQYRINTDKPMNQAMNFVIKRCREQNLDETTRLSHGMRFFAILDFLRDNNERLWETDLLRAGAKEEAVLLSEHLMAVLAVARYTKETGEIGGSGPVMTFDPDDVIIEAGLRQQADPTA